VLGIRALGLVLPPSLPSSPPTSAPRLVRDQHLSSFASVICPWEPHSPHSRPPSLPPSLPSYLSRQGSLDKHLSRNACVVGSWQPQGGSTAHTVEAGKDVLKGREGGREGGREEGKGTYETNTTFPALCSPSPPSLPPSLTSRATIMAWPMCR